MASSSSGRRKKVLLLCHGDADRNRVQDDYTDTKQYLVKTLNNSLETDGYRSSPPRPTYLADLTDPSPRSALRDIKYRFDIIETMNCPCSVFFGMMLHGKVSAQTIKDAHRESLLDEITVVVSNIKYLLKQTGYAKITTYIMPHDSSVLVKFKEAMLDEVCRDLNLVYQRDKQTIIIRMKPSAKRQRSSS
jgi:hypothetical protein